MFELLVGVLVVLSGPSDPLLLLLARPESGVQFNLRITTQQICEAVPRRARIEGS